VLVLTGLLLFVAYILFLDPPTTSDPSFQTVDSEQSLPFPEDIVSEYYIHLYIQEIHSLSGKSLNLASGIGSPSNK